MEQRRNTPQEIVDIAGMKWFNILSASGLVLYILLVIAIFWRLNWLEAHQMLPSQCPSCWP